MVEATSEPFHQQQRLAKSDTLLRKGDLTQGLHMDGERTFLTLQRTVARSAKLGELIQGAWDSSPDFEEPRAQAAQRLCVLSIDHSQAFQALLPEIPASAMVLVRPQYESLVRAVWALHAASEPELELLLAPLTPASQQAAKKLPGIADMIAKLDKSGPQGASAMFRRARERMADGLNSFVHGGIHPFARQRDGYPVGLLIDMLTNSNALALLSLLVLADIAMEEAVLDFVRKLHDSFQDVLPALEPFDS